MLLKGNMYIEALHYIMKYDIVPWGKWLSLSHLFTWNGLYMQLQHSVKLEYNGVKIKWCFVV